jgi:hypothetical protein
MRSVVFCAALSLTLVGCATGGPDISPGFLFSSVEGPVTATGAPGGNKHGTACASNILGLVAMGDNSIDAAKKDGGVKTISHVDYDMFNILGFYQKKCTHVTGSGGK